MYIYIYIYVCVCVCVCVCVWKEIDYSEKCAAWKYVSYLTSQEFPHILWKQEVPYS